MSEPERTDPEPATSTQVDTSGGSLLRIAGGFLVIGLFGVGGVFAWNQMHAQPPPEIAAAIGAKLELAAGEVVLVSEGEPRTLLSSTPLPVGARLETKPGARALIRLADGSRIFMRDASVVELGDDTGVTVVSGEIWLETPPLDRNRDPLVHRIAGAELALTDGGASLAMTDAGARIYVADGIAAVTTAGGRREVRSGERANIDGAAQPSVESVAYWDDWTGGMADRRAGGSLGSGAGALFAVDKFGPAGSKALPLQISRQTVDVAIENGLAETRVDQRFFNPSERDVEGWYWFTVPEDAMLVGFALETDGVLVEGEIVERQQAVATYERAAASDDNPALLEWIDDRTVRARIYPVPAAGERRIVVRYQQLLSESEGKLVYTYPLAAAGGRNAVTIEEFALAVELRADIARDYTVATSSEAKLDQPNRLVTMRRSGFTPRADFELELTRKPDVEIGSALRLNEYESGSDHARFVMLRWLPDLDGGIDWGQVATPTADVVVVVDTSAFGDASEHQSRIATAEALLRSLATTDRFALLAADLSTEVLHPAEGMSEATAENISAALERLTNHRAGGATDLGAIFERALQRVHGAEQPAIIYIGDGLATSGDRGSDALAERLRRTLTGSRARLFTIGVGTDVDERLLARLARVGGGQSFRVEASEQAVVRALELSSAIKTPTITDLEVDLGQGLDDRFDNATGKLSRGEELVVLARTHHEMPTEVTIRGRVGGEDREWTYPLEREKGVLDVVVPKLWASAHVERLLGDGRGPDAVRGKILSLGLEYGMMTPFSSFLALESESAYGRQGVERRRRPWDFRLLAGVLPHEREFAEQPRGLADDPNAGELLLGALGAPFGCSMDSKPKDAAGPKASGSRSSADQPESEVEEQVQDGRADRHKGEEGKMGKPSSADKSGLYAMKGEKNDVPQAGNDPAEPEPEAVAAAPMAEPPAPGASDEDVWGGLTGQEVGEAYGVGGLGIVGTGRGGGGEGEGTIGLGNTGLIGKGGGGGTGSGYGRGSGAGFGGRGSAVASVRQAKATVTGALDSDIIRRIVRAHINEVRACYNSGLVRNPSLEGRVEIEFMIAGDGKVESSSVGKSTLDDATVGTCVAEAVEGWRFPKPEGGGIVSVRYPFMLSPGESSDGSAADAPAPAASWRPTTTSPVARDQKSPCSDASARSLAQRKLLWDQRMVRSRDMVARLTAYEAAAGACELSTWREDQAFLQMLQATASTEAEVELLIAHFWDRSDAREFVTRSLLRRLVDRSLVAAVERTVFGPIDWSIIDAKVSLATTDDEKFAALQAGLDQAPGAPEGELRMMDLLFQRGRTDDAIARGRRLRDRGQMTPVLAERLGELLVHADQREDAKRVFSEIVEFDPHGAASRRMLGDIFLRHGWYQEAYRQYEDLLARTGLPSDAIRMARAASGAGRVDEGLRILRKVATGEGRPGADDPRRWARLHAAVMLAQLFATEDSLPDDKLARELQRLQLFDAPATWTFVIWHDLGSTLVLGPKPLPPEPSKEAIAQAVKDSQRVTDYVLAGDTGLWAIERGELGDLDARHSGLVPARDVVFERIEVVWDGASFAVVRTTGTVVAKHAWQGGEAKGVDE